MNSGKSSDNSNSQTSRIKPRDILVLIILIVPVSGSLLLLWENRAWNVYQKTQPEYENVNGIRIANMTSTIVVQNYFPFRSTRIVSKIYKETNWTSDYFIDNTPEDIEAENITIYSYSFKIEYAGKEIAAPFKMNNPTSFPNLKSGGMSETTVIVKWSYNMSEPSQVQSWSQIHLSFSTEYTWFRSEVNPLLGPVLLYLVLAGSGFASAWLAFGKGKPREDYSILTRFTNKGWENVKDEKEEKSLRKGLQRIIAFPSEEGGFYRLIFGLGILIFKSMINSRCKKHHDRVDSYEITPYKKEELKKILSKYAKQTFKEIKDVLPELKPIIVGILFLASIGISFDWKIGAVAPLVVSIGLSYFFFNIGSLFYFVGKSKTDFMWMIGALLAGIGVASFPTIVEILRRMV